MYYLAHMRVGHYFKLSKSNDQSSLLEFRQTFNFIQNHLAFGMASDNMKQIWALHTFEVKASDRSVFGVFWNDNFELLLCIGVK